MSTSVSISTYLHRDAGPQYRQQQAEAAGVLRLRGAAQGLRVLRQASLRQHRGHDLLLRSHARGEFVNK